MAIVSMETPYSFQSERFHSAQTYGLGLWVPDYLSVYAYVTWDHLY